MKAQNAVSGLQALATIAGGLHPTGEYTTASLSARICLSSGADVSGATLRGCLDMLGLDPIAGNRFAGQDIRAAVGSAAFGRAVERLTALADGREPQVEAGLDDSGPARLSTQ